MLRFIALSITGCCLVGFCRACGNYDDFAIERGATQNPVQQQAVSGQDLLDIDIQELASNSKNPGPCSPTARPSSQCAPQHIIPNNKTDCTLIRENPDYSYYCRILEAIIKQQQYYQDHPDEYGMMNSEIIDRSSQVWNESRRAAFPQRNEKSSERNEVPSESDEENNYFLSPIHYKLFPDKILARPFNKILWYQFLDWVGKYAGLEHFAIMDVPGHPGEIAKPEVYSTDKYSDFLLPKYRQAPAQ